MCWPTVAGWWLFQDQTAARWWRTARARFLRRPYVRFEFLRHQDPPSSTCTVAAAASGRKYVQVTNMLLVAGTCMLKGTGVSTSW